MIITEYSVRTKRCVAYLQCILIRNIPRYAYREDHQCEKELREFAARFAGRVYYRNTKSYNGVENFFIGVPSTHRTEHTIVRITSIAYCPLQKQFYSDLRIKQIVKTKRIDIITAALASEPSNTRWHQRPVTKQLSFIFSITMFCNDATQSRFIFN